MEVKFMSQETMYPPQANSPGTELAQAITADATELTVQDGDVLLPAPNTVTIGSDETAETILYGKKEGNVLSEITRAWDGTAAKAWTIGSKVARYLNAQDISALQSNIKDLDSSVGDLAELQTTSKENTVAAINEVFTSVGNGKTLIADAITDKGVLTSATDTFGQMALNIDSISTEISGEKLEEFLLATDVKKGDAVGVRTVFTKLADPVVMPDVATYNVASSEDGKYLAIAPNADPYLLLYKREGDTFVKLPNLIVPPNAISQCIKFSGDYLYISAAVSGGRYMNVYKRNGDNFDKLSHTDLALGGTVYDFDVSPDGQYLAVGISTSSYIAVWKRNGDTFTRITSPFTNNGEIPTIIQNVAFSPDSSLMVIGLDSSPFMAAYRISNTGTFTKIAFPGTIGSFARGTTRFTHSGKYFVGCHNVSGYPHSALEIHGDSEYRMKSIFGDGNISGSIEIAKNDIMIGSHNSFSHLRLFKLVNGQSISKRIVGTVLKPYRIVFSEDVLAITATDKSPYFAAYKMSQQAIKITNTYQDMIDSDKIGYVKEDGQAGEIKQIAIVWED